MDGCDEDEHDEGAHQVGLEDLVPHLGVLQHEKEKTKRKGGGGGGGGEGKMRETSFQSEPTNNTPAHTHAHTSALPRMHASSTTSVRERQEPVG